MARRVNGREVQLRRAIAQEAARLMAEHGIEDFLLAKRKAAERLLVNSTNSTALPKNEEIEAALIEHQRLFQSGRHEQQIHDLRSAALRLMRLLEGFKPRLVGSVLSGSATVHTEINLHVFVNRAEQVAMRLEEIGILSQHAEKRFRYDADRQLSYPSFKFVAGQYAVEIVAFPVDGIRQSPISPVDGKPMARADSSEVEDLIQ